VPAFVPEWSEFGAPDRMKLGTAMLLQGLYNLSARDPINGSRRGKQDFQPTTHPFEILLRRVELRGGCCGVKKRLQDVSCILKPQASQEVKDIDLDLSDI
jgi:hypothetical protein